MTTSVLALPCLTPPLHPSFRPLVLAHRAFREAVAADPNAAPVVIGVERSDGTISRFETAVFSAASPEAGRNYPYIERLVKTLLWARGGWKVYLGGPRELGEQLQAAYAPGGARAFDADIMGTIYEKPFTVVPCNVAEVPAASESTVNLGGHKDGCRVGIDLGASDRKASAVMNGETVHTEEVVWKPREQSDPEWHFNEIMAGVRSAASHMPRVDAIGVSSAGVYVNSYVRIASLFRGVPKEKFETHVKPIFYRIQAAMGGVPMQVINDGDVTALSGAMTLGDNAVLGVAMGSSEAAGYVTPHGALTNWLNELAFVPIDADPHAPEDEWSKDIGCGVQYFSQQAVARLIPVAGLEIDATLQPDVKLKQVQALMDAGDARVRPIYETIGIYLGYALAYYAEFYKVRHAMILGRVTTGPGGEIILDYAQQVLDAEFPELASQMHLFMPTDETERRHGQAIAAASLPSL